MATGRQSTDSKRVITVRMVESATAANGAPTGLPLPIPAATVGYDLSDLGAGYVLPDSVTVRIYETAGSGTMTLSYARMWGYSLASGLWTPLGLGTGTDKGKLNNAAAFDESGNNQLRHSEPLIFLHHIDGIYVELGVFGGTATALTASIDFPRHAGR